MSIEITILLMLLGHLLADYTLQGWLADGKQKEWWDKAFGGKTPDKYKHDYKAALACHSLYWALIICAPLYGNAHIVGYVVANMVVHYIVDDMKANKKIINLVQDQLIHLMQIVITASFAASELASK